MRSTSVNAVNLLSMSHSSTNNLDENAEYKSSLKGCKGFDECFLLYGGVFELLLEWITASRMELTHLSLSDCELAFKYNFCLSL